MKSLEFNRKDQPLGIQQKQQNVDIQFVRKFGFLGLFRVTCPNKGSLSKKNKPNTPELSE